MVYEAVYCKFIFLFMNVDASVKERPSVLAVSYFCEYYPLRSLSNGPGEDDILYNIGNWVSFLSLWV